MMLLETTHTYFEYTYLFWVHILFTQHTDSNCPYACLKIRADIRMNMNFFRDIVFFLELTETGIFKPELFKELTGFTEAVLFFLLSLDYASPGTKHTWAAWVGRTIFTEAGFQMMVWPADPKVSSIFFSGSQDYTISVLWRFFCFCVFNIFQIFCWGLRIQNIPPVKKRINL